MNNKFVKRTLIGIGILFLIILIGIWSFRPPAILDPRKSEIDILKKQINDRNVVIIELNNKLNCLKIDNTKLQIKNDSLKLLKQKIIIKYHEIYTNINSASNQQLDDIIRTNW